MKKPIYKRYFLTGFIPILLISCAKNDDFFSKSAAQSDPPKSAYEELLAQGWKEIKSFSLMEKENLNPHSEKKASINVEEEEYKPLVISSFPHRFDITREHLNRLYGYSDSYILEDFNRYFRGSGFLYGTSIVGIAFNPSTVVGTRLTTHPIGDFSYFFVNAPIVSEPRTESLPSIIKTQEFTNPNDEARRFMIKYKYDEGYKTEWNSPSGSNQYLNERVAIAIPEATENGTRNIMMRVSVVPSLKNNWEQDSTKIRTRSDSIPIEIPPHSMVKVREVTDVTSTTVDYNIPFTYDGRLTLYVPGTPGNMITTAAKHVLERRARNPSGTARLTRYAHVHVFINTETIQ